MLTDYGQIIFNISAQTAIRNRDIAIFDIRTGIVVNLTHHSGHDDAPQWSPDNSQIAFLSTRNGPFNSIYIMDMYGRNLQRVTFIETIIWDFSWSPDGSHILYQIQEAGETTLVVVDLSSGQSWPVFSFDTSQQQETSVERRWIAQRIWSSDGQWIYVTVVFDGQWSTYRVSVQQLEEPNLIWQHNEQIIAQHDGRYFIAYEGGDVVVWDNVMQTAQLLFSRSNLILLPLWSPNGESIIYVRGESGQLHELHIVNRDGTNERLLATANIINHPRWLPDNHHVIFFSSHYLTHEPQLCIINVDDGTRYCFTSPYFRWELL